MHGPDPGVPTPTFSPTPTTYTTPQTVSMSDSLAGATIYYTTDGSIPNPGTSPVYSTPITITSTTSFRALATHLGYPRSNMALGVYTINLPLAPAPSFTPPPSTYSTPQSVKLSNSANLAMYFTLDGSTPTTSSTLYSGPITVSKNTTINAITAAYGYQNSTVSTGTYLIQAPTPTFAPGSGTYYTTQTVAVSDAVSGAAIYYTTNGSTPTTLSTACSNPCTLTVSTTTTVKAIASGGGYATSNIGTATYTIAASNPSFSPGAGTYYTPQTVTMTETTPGVLIYYTTNNSLPSTSSPSCSSPCQVAISTTTTLRAMAAGNGISQSGVTVGVYTIAAYTPTYSPQSGSYAKPLNVTISDASSGVTIYYTTDGSFPTTSSTPCTNPCPVTLTSTTTLKAIAAGTGISSSSVGVATYTLH
jgi:hypothetical protein